MFAPDCTRARHGDSGYFACSRLSARRRTGVTLAVALAAAMHVAVRAAAQAGAADTTVATVADAAAASDDECADTLGAAFAMRDRPAGVGRCDRADTVSHRRAKAVTLSDAYETRLAIHKIASYATLPLFTAQAIVGQQLFVAEQAGNRPSKGMRDTHDLLAVGVGALFAVNTFTGALNWWETRSQTDGRTWRTIHGALMLASDAGFAYTAFLGTNARHLEASRVLHKNWAIGSASTALVSYVMMLSPFRRD